MKIVKARSRLSINEADLLATVVRREAGSESEIKPSGGMKPGYRRSE
jgi:hypothetical protein